jgi:dihydroorotase
MATLIKQAYLLGAMAAPSKGIAPDASTQIGAEGTADVLVEEGVISAIAPFITDLPPETNILDGRGRFLGPGLVDLYSQSGQPGHESRETHTSIMRAAAAGGFTRVGLLPNTQPAVDNVGAIATIHQANLTQAYLSQAVTPTQTQPASAQLLPWATITLAGAGKQLTDLAELAETGALGFTDAAPLNNPALLRRLLEYAQPLQKPIALWPYDPHLAQGGFAREGVEALRLGLSGVSAIAETSALAALIEYLVEFPALVHIMRLSTAGGVALLKQAKARELPVSASVPWHHLVFDTQDLASYDPNLRHNPPLGNAADRQALIAGVAEGVIDAIAVDHSPYTYEEKTVAFDQAPAGAIGLELALPILWQRFVANQTADKAVGATDKLTEDDSDNLKPSPVDYRRLTLPRWSPAQLWQALSDGPAHCLGLTPASIAVGEVADMTLFDPRIRWQVSAENLQSLACNTPWEGQWVQGKVVATWVPHVRG